MPTPGPVAYHVQSGSFVVAVISSGLLQVSPSSLLELIKTVRVPFDFPAMISRSRSCPRFRVIGSQIVPVARSTTGQGFPIVLGESEATTPSADHVRPSSVERLTTISISPLSDRPFFLPSANASNVPL